MSTLLTPQSEDELAQIVAKAHADRTPLEVVGGGTRKGLGRPTQAAATVSTRGLTGITLYEPSELVIGALAGTPLSEIEAAIDKNNQMLTFEPPDYRALYGTEGEPTIGAIAACNLSGPRRIQAGAARDSLLGVRFVNGKGEAIKNGGRVMKNVTGYDLVKLSAGAHGTLGVLTEVIFKVLPRPESEATLVLEGLDATAAVAALSAGLGSPFEITGAAYLPDDAGPPSRTVLRIEGFPVQITYRGGRLVDDLSEFGKVTQLDADASRALWRDIRDVAALPDAGPSETAVWRISVRPSNGPAVAEAVSNLGGQYYMDWGGGLIWVAMPLAQDDAGAEALRGITARLGGHATLMRAPESVRAAVPVFEPEVPALAALTAKLTAAFDPDGIINPGRMYAGI